MPLPCPCRKTTNDHVKVIAFQINLKNLSLAKIKKRHKTNTKVDHQKMAKWSNPPPLKNKKTAVKTSI